jgi:flagellar protein FlaJ
VLSGLLLLALSSVIFFLPQSPFHNGSPYVYILLITLIGVGASAIGFPFYLQNEIENKKRDIDKQIPYALAFMSILASSGATPLEIIRRLSREDYGQISNEFRKVLFRVDILGEDVVTAMNGLVHNTPSDLFRDICVDLTNIIYGGGGLKSYLETKSKELMAIRRQTYKEFVESLAIFGEGYLGGVVMTLTLAILGIVISGALGIELGPFEPKDLFKYLIYLIIPLINIVFLQMLSVKYSTNP